MSPLGPSSAGLVGRVVLCVLVGAALLSPAAGAGPAPAYGAAGDQLVLEHYDGVVLAGIDGAGHRVVGPLGQDPSLAPDGRYLAYLLPAAGDPELWVARVDGTDARPVAAPAAGPLTWSEDGGHVAFVRGNGIAVVPRDGGEVRQVSVPPAGAVDSAPAWAPRGNELAFIRSLPGSLQQLRLWSPDGGERLVAEGGFGQRLTWSPDRRELFYADRDVHAVAVATGTVRTVARPSADGLDAEVPVPSPDGTKVAFGANPVVFETQNDRHYRGGFFVVDASGSHAGAGTALAAFSDGLEMTLGWSPDSRHLVAGTSALEDGGNVWYYRLLAADGSGATTLALSAADQTYVRLLQPHFLPAPVPLPPASRIAFAHPRSSDGRRSILALWQDGSRADELTQDGDDTDPAWAPDGGRLAFVRWYDDATAEVRVLDLATSTHAAVTPRMPNLYRPVWSSDGGRIAFDSDVDLYVADADGGALRRVTDTAPGDPGGWESQPRWSPDGAALVFVHTTQLNEEQWTADELGVIDLATGTRRTLTQGTSPDWSTAGIAFARDGVRVIRPDGTGERLVDPGEAFRVRWSPDRGRLVSAGPGGVRVIEVVAEGSARLVAEGESSVATWTGDGEAVAYRDARHNLQVQPLRLPFVTAGTGGAAGWDLAPEPAPLRLGGRTRIETAVTISRATFETATAVVVARADAYPDALAGAPLARQAGGPLLLTAPARLEDPVAREITRLAADEVILLGDDSALSDEVEASVRALGVPTVRRLGGSNRYATAAHVAAELAGSDVLYMVEGGNADPARGWPDAVAVSALAAAQGRPILLVERDRLPAETAAALTALGAAGVTIVGGEAAVGAGVQGAVEDLGLTVHRIAGTDRFATSALVADRTGSPATAWLATGRNWPDALAAGLAAAGQDGALLLVDGADLDGSPEAAAWLTAHPLPASRLRLVGSTDVVSQHAGVQAEQAVTGGAVTGGVPGDPGRDGETAEAARLP